MFRITQPSVPGLQYRPELDGLRAIAVMAVVLYHARMGLSGGFVGVDIFFVISGFLITSQILKELQANTFTLAGFWERRIRRIVPALACLVLATLVIGWIVLLPDAYAELGRQAFFQGLFVANIYFWRSTGYFDGNLEEKPLLHTWSLAVEEQFYFVFPLLLAGLYRIPSFRSRNALLFLCCLGIGLSLIISIWGVANRPAAAFYLLPTRAWEFLLGALVAILPAPVSTGNSVSVGRFAVSDSYREVFSWLSLVGIVVPCWFYTSATPFPGISAVLPCGAAAIFIWFTGCKHPEARLPTAARVLSIRPLVFVGLISYSLYLWHWPLFTFSKYLSIEPLSLGHRWLLVAISFLIAILSWRFVETPFRRRRLCESRRSVFSMGALATGLTVAGGLAVHFNYAIPQRFTPETLAYARGQTDWDFLHELEISHILKGQLTPIGTASPDAPVDWLVWGDSHAMAVTPAFHQYLKARGLNGQAATHSWTAPLLGYFKGPNFGMGLDSLKFNQAVYDHLKRRSIKDVVLVGAWSGYDSEPIDHPSSGTFESSLVATVVAIRDAGARPWIMLEIPGQKFDVPKVLAQYAMSNQPIEPLCSKPNPEEYGITRIPGLVERLQEAGATLLDPRSYCLSEDGSHYRVAQDGKALYRDGGHLSTFGAAVIALPMLENSLSE